MTATAIRAAQRVPACFAIIAVSARDESVYPGFHILGGTGVAVLPLHNPYSGRISCSAFLVGSERALKSIETSAALTSSSVMPLR